MNHHNFVSEQSRKAKLAKSLYDYLQHKNKGNAYEPNIEWETIVGQQGIRVPVGDRHRVLNMKFQDEHMSPYIVTDMNLFHMMMMDEHVDTVLYKADKGWLFLFDGIPAGPKPFGQDGHDMR